MLCLWFQRKKRTYPRDHSLRTKQIVPYDLCRQTQEVLESIKLEMEQTYQIIQYFLLPGQDSGPRNTFSISSSLAVHYHAWEVTLQQNSSHSCILPISCTQLILVESSKLSIPILGVHTSQVSVLPSKSLLCQVIPIQFFPSLFTCQL